MPVGRAAAQLVRLSQVHQVPDLDAGHGGHLAAVATNSTHAIASASTTPAMPPASHRMPGGHANNAAARRQLGWDHTGGIRALELLGLLLK